MAKSKLSDREQVDELILKLPPLEKSFVSYVRSTTLAVSMLISEQVKWNSLSFFYNGEMKRFDPKEYKRDIMVCNIHRGKFLLVFPTGSKLTDKLHGKDFPDGRKIITIDNLEHLKEQINELGQIIKDWLKQVE